VAFKRQKKKNPNVDHLCSSMQYPGWFVSCALCSSPTILGGESRQENGEVEVTHFEHHILLSSAWSEEQNGKKRSI